MTALLKMATAMLGMWALGRFTDGQWWTAPIGIALGLLSVSALRPAASGGVTRTGGDLEQGSVAAGDSTRPAAGGDAQTAPQPPTP